MFGKKCKAGVVFDDLRKTFSNRVCPLLLSIGVKAVIARKKAMDDRGSRGGTIGLLMNRLLGSCFRSHWLKIKKEQRASRGQV